jgi:hypothetical protein
MRKLFSEHTASIRRALLSYLPEDAATDKAPVITALLAGTDPRNVPDEVRVEVSEVLCMCDQYTAVLEGSLDMALDAVILAWKEGRDEA